MDTNAGDKGKARQLSLFGEAEQEPGRVVSAAEKIPALPQWKVNEARIGGWEKLLMLDIRLGTLDYKVLAKEDKRAYSELHALCEVLPKGLQNERAFIDSQLEGYEVQLKASSSRDAAGLLAKARVQGIEKRLKEYVLKLQETLLERADPVHLMKALEEVEYPIPGFAELNHELSSSIPVLRERIAYDTAVRQLTEHRGDLSREEITHFNGVVAAYGQSEFGHAFWEQLDKRYPKALVKAFAADLKDGADPSVIPPDSALHEVMEAAWCARLLKKVQKIHKGLGYSIGE